jgi:Flp pilus assembly protein TadG
MILRHRNLRLARRGNALVEFVLVLPLLLLLLLGAIDWGFYFIVRETVINATREGARVGSVASGTAQATADARVAVENYLRNALGAAYVRTPTVSPTNIAGSPAIAVRLVDYPVVPSRPTRSITGWESFSRVPTTITTAVDMRLETPTPAPGP